MPANYVLLEEVTLTSSTASVTLDNIPQTGYTDLLIKVSGRTLRPEVQDGLYMVINGINSTGFRNIEGNGSTPFSRATANYGNNWMAYIPGANSTSSTFSNTDIYITNYNTSLFKSILSDSVQENDATLSYMALNASLWSNTASVTSLGFGCNANFDAGTTFYLYGVANFGTTPVIAPKATGGNIITNDGTYWYHTFLASGVFTPNQTLTCDYLVVAGGAGGGNVNGGGGGAGGMRSTVNGTGGSGSLESPLSLTSNTNYTVTVGAGGATGATSFKGNNGSDSVFGTITSTGGGGGGSYASGQRLGNAGGSGGGGGYYDGNPSNTPIAGTGGAASPSGQGFAGGNAVEGAGTQFTGAGGGGAASVGANVTSTGSGTTTAGGSGRANSISGSSVTYAAGGVGKWGGETGAAGSANTGNGGGAGTSGGSGIVIVRYTMA